MRKDYRKNKMGGGMMKPMYETGGKVATTPKEKKLAAKYGDKKTITRGDVITAAKEKSGTRKNAMGGGMMRKEFNKGGGSNRPGLYANIKAKKDRIKGGSGEKMRKVGAKGAPTAQNFKDAAKTAKKV